MGARSSPSTGSLERITTDNPMVTLNRAVATAMVDGPDAGPRGRRPSRPRRSATTTGSTPCAGTCSSSPATATTRSRRSERAAGRTTSTRERDYLTLKAATLARA